VRPISCCSTTFIPAAGRNTARSPTGKFPPLPHSLPTPHRHLTTALLLPPHHTLYLPHYHAALPRFSWITPSFVVLRGYRRLPHHHHERADGRCALLMAVCDSLLADRQPVHTPCHPPSRCMDDIPRRDVPPTTFPDVLPLTAPPPGRTAWAKRFTPVVTVRRDAHLQRQFDSNWFGVTTVYCPPSGCSFGPLPTLLTNLLSAFVDAPVVTV